MASTTDAMAAGPIAPQIREFTAEEQYYVASQWQLMWRKFRRHRLGFISAILLVVAYFFAMTYDFWVPYDFQARHEKLSSPPTSIPNPTHPDTKSVLGSYVTVINT